MSTTVRLSISGKGKGTDAPPVGELLDQIRDYFAMLDGVVASIAGDEKRRFQWRIVDASRNSPLALVAEAFPEEGFQEVEGLVSHAKRQVTFGLEALRSGIDRPPNFTDNVLEAAHRFTRRNTEALKETVVHHGDGLPDVVITRTVALELVANIGAALDPPPLKPYREYGTVEGHIRDVGADGYGRPFVNIRLRLTGADVKCYLSGDALRSLEAEPVANVVWRNRRVEAQGMLRFRSLGRLSQADIQRLRFLRSNGELPQFEAVIHRGFTNGQSSEEYLERIRRGDDA